LVLGEVKSSERFPLANKAKKRSELFTSPNIFSFLESWLQQADPRKRKS